MRRSTVLLFMLFVMLWQSVALARAGSTVNALADSTHAALHWQGEAHHHHGDGGYHVDDSLESKQHALIDHVSAPAALWDESPLSFAPMGTTALPGLHQRPVPSPTLDGLLRPPRFTS